MKVRWRIGVVIQEFHMVELEAESPEVACLKAIDTVRSDTDKNFLTATNMQITSCMINDKRSKDFVPYIPERIPGEKTNGLDSN